MHSRVYHLLGVYLILLLFGLEKLDSPLISTWCLKIFFFQPKFVRRLCCENEILIRYVMVVHSECGGWLKFTSDCSRYRFTMLFWLCKKRLVVMVVLSSNRFQFRLSSWVSLWLDNHPNFKIFEGSNRKFSSYLLILMRWS